MTVFEQLPLFPVEIELTTAEQDYLAGLPTETVSWTGTVPALTSIVAKLKAAHREAHEEAIAQAEHEAAVELATDDGIGMPYHDRPEERDGLR